MILSGVLEEALENPSKSLHSVTVVPSGELVYALANPSKSTKEVAVATVETLAALLLRGIKLWDIPGKS
jgi:hypothetical protein